MEANPRKIREIYVQLLYALQETGDVSKDSIDFFMAIFQVSRKNVVLFIDHAKKIYSDRDLFDCYLSNISLEYSLDRIAKVDLAILRVILYDLIHKKIPIEIAIAEAIRLANKFSSYGSPKYLHAMIDAIYKEIHHGAAL
jgi:N utilization substance protein B